MVFNRFWRILAFCVMGWVGPMVTMAAERLDDTPRIAVISAFEPEWDALIGRMSETETHTVNGMAIVTGTLEGKPVVLMMSGISMVNAAMNSQLLLDRFHVTHIVFSGIAGGIDPKLRIGDVVAPARWAQSLESIMGRKAGEAYVKPDWLTWAPEGMKAFGMIMPNSVIVGNAAVPPEPRVWFEADPALLAVARTLKTSGLKHCTTDGKCLDHHPQVLTGGDAVSSPAFVDNADYRDYLFTAYGAQVADMESAAVAQVAFANQVPFIAFRSVSDLAGGDIHANQMAAFMALASENSATVVCLFVRALPEVKP